jgi:hypothetical protein
MIAGAPPRASISILAVAISAYVVFPGIHDELRV